MSADASDPSRPSIVARAAKALTLAREQGLGELAHELRVRAWADETYLGLRCDLAALPPAPAAKIAVTMEPVGREFGGFLEELGTGSLADRREARVRQRWLEAGARTWYVAFVDRRPAYAQMLLLPGDHVAAGVLAVDLAALGPDGAFLEGAYTFAAFRRQGAMAAGMHQLLVRARELGLAGASTYVAPDNVASLRGCRRVGFYLEHARRVRRRGGRQHYVQSAPSAADRMAWETAVAGL